MSSTTAQSTTPEQAGAVPPPTAKDESAREPENPIAPMIELDEYQETVLDLLPAQGRWSEDDYLWLTDLTNRLVEMTDGTLEPLPMPTTRHQAISLMLLLALHAHIVPKGGKVYYAPLRLRVRPGMFREPDLMLLKDASDLRKQDRFWTGADVALEIVSEDKPERDLVDKRTDYAVGGVPEYWIVNPLDETITVLKLEGAAYVEHGVFARGSAATSATLDGFQVDVDTVFNAD